MKHHKYGTKSQSKLATCHPAWRQVAEDALDMSPYDITIIHGLRGKELQNRLFAEGKSKKQFPDSRHNKSDDPVLEFPTEYSDAIDFGPIIDGRIPWNDTHIFAVVAGCFFAAAAKNGVKLRWGGDWDGDGSTRDQSLMDWGHMEIDW